MNAVFLKLLNMSAAGSVLILAVIVLRALLKRAPRWIFCVMWALVAVRLVCPFSIPSPLSAFRATPSIVGESGEVEIFRAAGGSEKPLLAVGTVQIERPQTSAETIKEIPGTPLAVTQRTRDAYLPPLIGGWLLGVAAMLLYAAGSTLLLRRKVAASLRQRGNIRVCDAIPSPFILGLARPRIYLPSSLNEEERRFVLAHERAHLRRLDHLWKPLGFLILSVHWFNPLCWLAYALFCRDIELACDEKVVGELGRSERAAYSQALLNCSAHRILAACPVAFGETDVKTRVKAVLNYKKPAFWIVLAAALGCIVLILCFATKPTPGEPDLSFLNYKNAISPIGQNDTAPYANLYPADSDGVRPGVADSKALAQLLENAKWTKRRAPSPSPEPRGCIEFMIGDDYRILLYQSERLAAVRFGNDIRYYRTAAGDYEAALAAFIPAPSTAPDVLPTVSAESIIPGKTAPFTLTSNGVTVEPYCTLWYDKTWTGNGWLISGDPDDPVPAILPDDYEKIPTVTLAEDFKVRYDRPQSYICKVCDEQFRVLRDLWYSNTAVLWLEPGTYYCVIPAWGPQGRYIESEVACEETLYHCVFRLIVPEGGAGPYTPEKAVSLKEARLRRQDEDYVLTDAAALAKLESWLKNAAVLPGGAGCPFGSVLTLTLADGSTISCCPAEDSCGTLFSNGVYYRYDHDNEEFWALFGIKLWP